MHALHAGRISLTPPRARHWTLRKLQWRKLVTLMSACSGRNYIFRCINVVFCVFLRESARTAAKSRTNLSTNSGKATKRLGRLAPNLAHICKFIWEWIYAKQIAPQDTRGHLEGFRGSTIQKSGKLSDWHQLWFTPADSSGNGHKLNTSRPSIPQGAFRGVRVSQIQKSGKAGKRLDRLAQNLAHICRSIWECIYTKQIAPRDTRGALRGVLDAKH